jgi:hypothetical protein
MASIKKELAFRKSMFCAGSFSMLLPPTSTSLGIGGAVMKLWYRQAAEQWTEALPLWNGRLGVMVYGKTGEEILALNEDSLWSGYPRDLNPRNRAETSKSIRDLAIQRRFAETRALFEKEISAPESQFYCVSAVGILKIDREFAEKLSEIMKNLGVSPEASSLDRKFILRAGVHTPIRRPVYNFSIGDELDRGKPRGMDPGLPIKKLFPLRIGKRGQLAVRV